MMKKKISLVIPVFNEAQNIFPLYEKLQAVLILLSDNFAFEILFVDDGSSDSSWQEISALHALNSSIRGVSFSRNFGKEMALTAGYELAKGDAVITMDGDLQHPVEIIPVMLKKWQEGFQIVYTRNKSHYESRFKRLAAYAHYKLLTSIASFSIPPYVQDFRLIDRRVLEILKKSKHRARYLRGMIASTGFKAAYIDVEYKKRLSGKSSLSIARLLRMSFDGMTAFSGTPLRLAGFFSVLFFFASFIAGISFIVYQTLGAMFFFIFFLTAGLIFSCLWLLGEYVARIYDELKGAPLYVIQSECGTLRSSISIERSPFLRTPEQDSNAKDQSL